MSYFTINTSDNQKPPLSNESTERIIKNFTEQPRPQEPSSQKRPFPYTMNPTINNVQKNAQKIPLNNNTSAKL